MPVDKPLANESMMGFFRRTRKFSDLILLGWGIIEFDIDQMVVSQFGLMWDDKRNKFLLDTPFGKKLEFLKDNKVFDNDEFKILKSFSEYRNKIFHGKEAPHTYTELEKDEMMDNAVKATDIAHRALFRKKK